MTVHVQLTARCLLDGCRAVWRPDLEPDPDLWARRHTNEGGKLKGATRPGHPTIVEGRPAASG